MVWDAHTKTHTKPLDDKHERAMGCRTGSWNRECRDPADSLLVGLIVS